jgi:hypothetical protein
MTILAAFTLEETLDIYISMQKEEKFMQVTEHAIRLLHSKQQQRSGTKMS